MDKGKPRMLAQSQDSCLSRIGLQVNLKSCRCHRLQPTASMIDRPRVETNKPKGSRQNARAAKELKHKGSAKISQHVVANSELPRGFAWRCRLGGWLGRGRGQRKRRRWSNTGGLEGALWHIVAHVWCARLGWRCRRPVRKPGRTQGTELKIGGCLGA